MAGGATGRIADIANSSRSLPVPDEICETRIDDKQFSEQLVAPRARILFNIALKAQPE
jgi:hypothetical protein